MNKKHKNQFNIHVNEEELKIIEDLRENHAINLSGAFKIFLRELRNKLNETKN